MNTLQAAAASTPYGQKVQNRRLQTATRLAVGGVDVYTAGASTLAAPDTALAKVMPWACGAAAVGHAVYGISQVFTDTTERYTGNGYVSEWQTRPAKDYVVGTGHLLTAAGFATLAFGLGPWALPILAIGQVTTLAGDMVG